MRYLWVLFSFLFGTSAQAGWNAQTVNLVKNYEAGEDDLGLFDQFQASFWNGVKSRINVVNLYPVQNLKVETHFQKEVPVLIHKQMKSESLYTSFLPQEPVAQKRKLILVIPGMFSNANDSIALKSYLYFRQHDHHVAVLPNPWSPQFIMASNNEILPGDLQAEADALLALSKTIIEHIGKENITEVELYGESYGGFAAAVMSALDEENLISGQVSVLSAPLHFMHTANSIDQLMNLQLSRKSEYSSWSKYRVFFNYLTASGKEDLIPLSENWTNYIVIVEGFQKNLKKTFKLLDSKLATNYSDRIDIASYNIYLDTYGKSLKMGMESETANLSHWMNLAIQKNKKLRVLVTKNDFLYNSESWQKFSPEQYTESQLLVLPTGGHLGYLSFPWFQEFFSVNWGEKAREFQVLAEKN